MSNETKRHPADEPNGTPWPFRCYHCGKTFDVAVRLGEPSKHVPHCRECMEGEPATCKRCRRAHAFDSYCPGMP